MTSWTYAVSLGRERLEALEDAPSFEEIARSIATTMRIQCSHVDPCDEADGFKRFVACVVVERTLFDLFSIPTMVTGAGISDLQLRASG